MRKIFFIVLALISAYCLLSAACSFAAIGNISKGSGAIYFKAKAGKKWAAATAGAEINEGDRIKTGKDGRIELALQDGSKLTVGNNTEMEITRFLLDKDKNKRGATIFLVQGKLRAIVAKFTGKTDMKVKTPTAVAGVKGTDFIVMNEGKANVLFGHEGAVEVKGKDKESVALSPDTMTENTQGHTPIAPVKVEPNTPLADARKQLEAVTDVDTPVEWQTTKNLPIILARWNINYGHYLADSGKYKEALEVFQIAADLTDMPEIGAESRAQRGTVFSRNLSLPQDALKEYQIVLDKYPQMAQAENALFSIGMIYKDIGEKEKATEYLQKYLKQYPQGKHSSTVELLIKELEKEENKQ
ncbi:MAG: FecR domain-containing protein [Deltaproteobacteria bacterium]|nr:FecR domain-containing protein [Deltaproteobacteria bacterium]